MPQLISHRDGFGWQTPNVTDILEIVPDNRDKTGQLRLVATSMVRRFAELGAPIRLRRVEPHPSHTRYHLQMDKVGVRGQERDVTLEDVRRVLPEILPELGGQSYELVTDGKDGVILFLRTPSHVPLRLASLLYQKTFLQTPSYTMLALGADLQQKVLVRDLTALRNVLVVGTSAARLHVHTSIALTLALFNSPSYLRIGLVGDESSHLRHLAGSPHVLGSVVSSTTYFCRLLDGLVKHLSQRRGIFAKQNVTSLDQYNKQALSIRSLKPLPRILLLVDTVALKDWRNYQDQWLMSLHTMLTKGADYGIHVILSVPDDHSAPDRINRQFDNRLILRSAIARTTLSTGVPLQFIDSLFIQKDSEMLPVELPVVAEVELTRLVTYWQNIKARRGAEMQEKGTPLSSGDTGLLTLRDDMLPQTNMLKSPLDTEPPMIDDTLVASAQALAAYIGWLGIGPLRDVLHLSISEAEETLRILRAMSVLEPGDGPIWRFVRLVDPPPKE